MPKISSYADGGAVQNTDKFIAARSGSNVSILGSEFQKNETITYLTSGSGNWSPAAATRYFIVELVGGGGAGGGCTGAASNCGLGSGGSGGGYACKKYDAPLAASYAYAVGAGGAGASNAAGNDGNNSTFDTITAAAGKGGSVLAIGTSAVTTLPATIAGGGAVGGDLNIPGGPCGAGIRLDGANGVSGAGGNSFLGTGGAPRRTNAASAAGSSYGSGGGGAFQAGSASARAGGNGANGIIIIHEFS